MPEATLIATLTEPPAEDGSGIDRLPAHWLEVRADLVGDLEIEALRKNFPGKLLYTLRSVDEGGGFKGPPESRAERFLAARSAGYDRIDLEAERDLTSEILDAIPPDQRLLSWHGPPQSVEALERRFQNMSATPAALYKLIPEARRSGQELSPLLFLRRLGRRDVACFCAGAIGTWTRLIACRLGAPWIYGACGEVPGAPGQPSVDRLVKDFGLPDLPPIEALFGVAGNPVGHSLSPRIHNAAYRDLGIPALYLPFHVDSFGDFWLEVVEGEALRVIGLPVQGLSITTPFKDVALAVAGASSPLAEHIAAANTLVRRGRVWEAESTDPVGVLEPLRNRGVEVDGRAVAVVGCGGAGRAAAVGLMHAGARVTLVNRGAERGQKAASSLHLPFQLLEEFEPGAFDAVIHATSLGREDETLPFEVDALAAEAVVVDLVYGLRATPLVEACRSRGVDAVDGREVLLHQAVGQFQIMTGKDMPLRLGRELLGLEPGEERRVSDAPT